MILWFVAQPGFQIIYNVSGTVNVMSRVLPATSFLLILGSFGAIIIAQWSPECLMWNHSIVIHTGRYCHQSFCNWGLFSSSPEVSGYLEYYLHNERTALYFWCFLSSCKCSIVIYCRGLIFPQGAVVLLLLESDAACTSLNGHCAGKKCIFGFKMMLQSHRWWRTVFFRYWRSELCITKWYDMPSGYGCLSKKCWLREQ